MGAFLENILQASEALGLKVKSSEIQFSNLTNKPICVLEFKDLKAKQKNSILQNIELRQSNRGKYDVRGIESKTIAALEKCQIEKYGTIKLITNRTEIEKVAEMSSMAIGMAMSIQEFRDELSANVHSNLSSAKTGFKGYSLGLGVVRSVFEPTLIKHGFNRKSQMNKELGMMSNSAAIAAVFGRGDTQEYWLECGRMYERMCLKATELGVAHTTSAAVVEAADFHTEIEKMCKTRLRLQAIVRLGYSKNRIKPAPKLSLEEIIRSN